MENPKHILRDLALIYIALAYGTDQRLESEEMDIIACRLQDVQPGVSQGTVLRAVKEALEAYTEEDAAQRVAQAVDRLRLSVPQSLRRRVVRDLTEIGKADDHFLFAEARFIGELVDVWKASLADPDSKVATWNVLGFAIEDEEAWTPVHDLALIYVTLAHRTDQTLSRDEVVAITKKIGEWLPNADDALLKRILHDVMRVYQTKGMAAFDEAVKAVKAVVPVYQRKAVLDDLRYVAYADHVLLVEERVLIDKLANAWECADDPWETDQPGLARKEGD